MPHANYPHGIVSTPLASKFERQGIGISSSYLHGAFFIFDLVVFVSILGKSSLCSLLNFYLQYLQILLYLSQPYHQSSFSIQGSRPFLPLNNDLVMFAMLLMYQNKSNHRCHVNVASGNALASCRMKDMEPILALEDVNISFFLSFFLCLDKPRKSGSNDGPKSTFRRDQSPVSTAQNKQLRSEY